jgi:subtilase family serine protease
VDVDWTLLISGTHAVWVEVDPNHEIAETDEGNNRASTIVDLEVDLAAAALRFDPIPPLIEGNAVTVTATAVVTHAGAVRVPDGVGAWFWMGSAGDGDLVVTRTLDGIAPGGQVEVTASWTLTLAGTAAGFYLVSVEIDPTDIVFETDESNNVLGQVLLIGNSRAYLPIVLRRDE